MSNTSNYDYSKTNFDWDRIIKIEQQEIEADNQPDPLEEIKQEFKDDWRLTHDKGFFLKNFYPDEYPGYLSELKKEALDEYRYDQTHDGYREYLKSTDLTEYNIYLAELTNLPSFYWTPSGSRYLPH